MSHASRRSPLRSAFRRQNGNSEMGSGGAAIMMIRRRGTLATTGSLLEATSVMAWQKGSNSMSRRSEGEMGHHAGKLQSMEQLAVIMGPIAAALVLCLLVALYVYYFRQNGWKWWERDQLQGMWAATKWKKGPRGKASFVPFFDHPTPFVGKHENQVTSSPSSFFSRLLPGSAKKGKERKVDLFDQKVISPYTYKGSPTIGYGLLDSSFTPHPGQALGRAKRSSYYRSPSSLRLDIAGTEDTLAKRRPSVQEHCPSPWLATPEVAHSSPRLRSAEEAQERWMQRGWSDRQSSLPLPPSPLVDYTHKARISEGSSSKEEKRPAMADVQGLGLNVGIEETSSTLSDGATTLSEETLQRALLWQPTSDRSDEEQAPLLLATSAVSRSSKGKQRQRSPGSSSIDSIPVYGRESIEEYSGSVYADKIADALAELRVQPSSSPDPCKIGKQEDTVLCGLQRPRKTVTRAEGVSKHRGKPRAATEGGIVDRAKERGKSKAGQSFSSAVYSSHSQPVTAEHARLCMSPEDTSKSISGLACEPSGSSGEDSPGCDMHMPTTSFDSVGRCWSDDDPAPVQPQRLFKRELDGLVVPLRSPPSDPPLPMDSDGDWNDSLSVEFEMCETFRRSPQESVEMACRTTLWEPAPESTTDSPPRAGIVGSSPSTYSQRSPWRKGKGSSPVSSGSPSRSTTPRPNQRRRDGGSKRELDGKASSRTMRDSNQSPPMANWPSPILMAPVSPPARKHPLPLPPDGGGEDTLSVTLPLQIRRRGSHFANEAEGGGESARSSLHCGESARSSLNYSEYSSPTLQMIPMYEDDELL